MKFLLTLPLFFMLSACTVNVTIADTHGYANDLVDETTRTEAEADVQIPFNPL